MLRIIALASALALAPSMAFAFSCPQLMAQIDAALPTTTVSDADKARAQELRAEGERLHNAGDHPGSEAALNEAKQILGI